MNTYESFKVIASKQIDHDHRHVLSLLYLPIIGVEALSLYFLLYALTNRRKLQSTKYPITLLCDMLHMSQQTLLKARQKLEATALLETFQLQDEYVYELYLPLSAEHFIKDSPFAPYLLNQLGQTRFEEMINLFEIKHQDLTNHENISMTFTELFAPAYTQIKTNSTFTEGKTHSPKITPPFDIDIFIKSLPDTLTLAIFKTTKYKERFAQIAYIFDMDETNLKEYVLKSFKNENELDFDKLLKHCQNHYQDLPIHQYTLKTSGYDIEYFKKVHPKNLVEDLTGMHVPSSDLKIIDTLITKSDYPLEVINVLIAFILRELNHQFPSYNYFEKVIAQWKRSGVKDADSAIEQIKIQIKKKTTSKTTTYSKYKKPLPPDVEIDWLDEYIKKFKEEM